jgi:tRNA modification GTPase
MNILQEFETIAAISTPIGTGGVGVIRISGETSFEIAQKITTCKNLQVGKICHGWVVDNDVKVDEVIILPFKAPNSYTGEDVIELQCHGGINVVRNVLDVVLKNGARPAERGEFTKRAFLNKKLDLSQAEAVDDLIHAKTSNFAIQSAKNLSGVLAKKINEIKASIFEVASRIVAGIDFPEDVAEPEYSYLIEKFTNSLNEVNKILDCAKSSDILRQGVKVAIVGRPNVGKSSLFNALLNLDRAIVTDIAGTTRDVIKENLDLGVAVTLIDTAGIRDDENIDKVEEIGIEYSKQSATEADLVLFLYDASVGLTDEDLEIFNIVKDKTNIVVANKIDMVENFVPEIENTAKLSVYTKDGLDELKQRLKDIVCNFSLEDTEFITNKRQQSCLEKCRISLENALDAANREELQDMIYIDLKSALLSLDEITGEVINDDILNNIFDHFCIGK